MPLFNNQCDEIVTKRLGGMMRGLERGPPLVSLSMHGPSLASTHQPLGFRYPAGPTRPLVGLPSTRGVYPDPLVGRHQEETSLEEESKSHLGTIF